MNCDTSTLPGSSRLGHPRAHEREHELAPGGVPVGEAEAQPGQDERDLLAPSRPA